MVVVSLLIEIRKQLHHFIPRASRGYPSAHPRGSAGAVNHGAGNGHLLLLTTGVAGGNGCADA